MARTIKFISDETKKHVSKLNHKDAKKSNLRLKNHFLKNMFIKEEDLQIDFDLQTGK